MIIRRRSFMLWTMKSWRCSTMNMYWFSWSKVRLWIPCLYNKIKNTEKLGKRGKVCEYWLFSRVAYNPVTVFGNHDLRHILTNAWLQVPGSQELQKIRDTFSICSTLLDAPGCSPGWPAGSVLKFSHFSESHFSVSAANKKKMNQCKWGDP